MIDAWPQRREGYDVAFYRNRNHMVVDCSLSFQPELPAAEEWWEPEAVISEETRGTYEDLCRLATGTMTRIIYLPPESNFSRALIQPTNEGNVYRPTGSSMRVVGDNFNLFLIMDAQDFAPEGLGCHGDGQEYFNVGNHTSGAIFVTMQPGEYYSFRIGPKVCLVDRGGDYPTRIAPINVVEDLVRDVMRPIEDDIKARVYEWTGDSKTVAQLPDRVV